MLKRYQEKYLSPLYRSINKSYRYRVHGGSRAFIFERCEGEDISLGVDIVAALFTGCSARYLRSGSQTKRHYATNLTDQAAALFWWGGISILPGLKYAWGQVSFKTNHLNSFTLKAKDFMYCTRYLKLRFLDGWDSLLGKVEFHFYTSFMVMNSIFFKHLRREFNVYVYPPRKFILADLAKG
jgi:hypothetical protein